MYNMKDVQNAIYSIVETRGKECYCILCHAIDVAIEHQPTMPKMQTICNEVRIRTGKKTNCPLRPLWKHRMEEKRLFSP